MANQRVIRIGTEFDTSGMLAGINDIRQKLNSLNVDSNLFKDVNKDIDKISKSIISISSSLKNGIPEGSINSFLKETQNVTKLFNTLPEKIRQVSIQTGNIIFPKTTLQRLDEMELEMEKLGKEAKNILGDDLRKNLKDALPDDFGVKFLDTLMKAKNKTEALGESLKDLKKQSQKAKQDLEDMFPKISNAALPKNSTGNEVQARTEIMRRINEGITNGNLTENRKDIADLAAKAKLGSTYDSLLAKIDAYTAAQEKLTSLQQQEQKILNIINSAEMNAGQKAAEIAKLQKEYAETYNNELSKLTIQQREVADKADNVGEKVGQSMKQAGDETEKANQHLIRQDSLLKQIVSRATALIGIGAIFNYITRGIRDAWNGIKDLDKEFTAIAVVTDKTTSQLWDSYSTYSQMAQGLGVATKDAVATSALYYQQGLKTADVMSLTAETIRMAQIAGMDFATATNQMTAAIRGFNLEMSQASMVNDIFSTLAANAAVSTQELSYALTKTASIAESAGMSIDTTSAFLTKMIETTREAPENIGTAMKSIIARFEELKKNPLALKVEVEGEEVVANKVEAAIALAGVKLRDATSGQFRDLDDVFLELAKSWDGLDRNTQRYIATIAAGSRQQSRFIALMDGYERTLELTELAQDSEGQSAAQFLKTLDSLDSKLNKVGNSLEQLYQKFVDSDLFGGLLEGLNDFLQGLGKLDAGTLATYAAVGVTIINTIINSIKRGAMGFSQVMTSLGQIAGESFGEKFEKTGIGQSKIAGLFSTKKRIKGIEEQQKNKLNSLNTKKEFALEDLSLNYKIKIDTKDANNAIIELKEKIASLENQIKQTEDNGLDATELIKNKVNAEQMLDDLQRVNEQYENQSAQIDEKAKVQIANIEQYMGQAMAAVGSSIAMSLVTSISTALDTGDASQALTTGFSTLALSALPQLSSIFMSAAGPVMMDTGMSLGAKIGAGLSAGLTATGPALIFLAIGAAVIALVAGIVWAASNIKSESQQLQEEVEALEEKQKELDDIAERSQAEASVSKTTYNKLDRIVETYDKLNNKVSRTVEEQEQLKSIQEDIAKDFPDLVWYYDEAGNAVLKQREEWERIIELQKESTKLAMGVATADKINSSLNRLSIAQKEQKLADITLQEKIKKSSGFSTEVHSKDEWKEQMQKSYITNGDIQIGRLVSGQSNSLTIKASDKNKEIYGKMLDNAINGATTERISKLAEELEFKDDEQKEAVISQIKKDMKGVLNTWAEIGEEFKNIEDGITPAEQKAKQAQKEATEAIAKYYEDYINNFIPKEQAESFSKVGINRIAKSFAAKSESKSLDDIIQGNDFWSKAVEKGVISEAKMKSLREKYSYTSIGATIPQVDLSKVTDPNDIDELEGIAKEIISKELDERAKLITEHLPEIEKLLSPEELNLFNTTDIGTLSKEQIGKLKEIYEKLGSEIDGSINFDDAVGQEIENLESRMSDWSTPIRNFADKFNANLAEALSKSGANDFQISAVDNLLSGYKDKAGSLTNVITNTDWTNSGQIKQLAEEFIKFGDTIDDAVQHTLELKQIFDEPIKLTLNADQAVADASEVAKTLNDMKKGLKDLNSAIQEYNENGRLSGETILDLIENGQLMYLEYDKETKAITINKEAMEKYYNLQVEEAKFKLQQKKLEVIQSINALVQRKKTLEQERNILLNAKNAEGKITEENYKELNRLNNSFSDDTVKIENTLSKDTLEIVKESFISIGKEFNVGFEGLFENIKSNGAILAENFHNVLSGNLSDIKTTAVFDSTNMTTEMSKIIDNAQKINYESVDGEYDYQLDTKKVQEMINNLDEQIKATDEFIAANTEYLALLDKEIDVTTALTESGMNKFLNDTAKATSDAKKELKDYVSTLERYYTLTKQVEKAEKERQKALKRFKKTGDTTDLDDYIAKTKDYLTGLSKEAYVGKKEKDISMSKAKEKLGKYFTKDELSKLQFDEKTGLVDLDAFHETKAYKSKVQNEKEGQKIDDILKDLTSDTEKYQGWIDAFEDAKIEIQEEFDDLIKETRKIVDGIDRLANIDRAMESISRILDESELLNEEYYTTGGREGVNGLEHLRNQAEEIKSQDLYQKELAKIQADEAQKFIDRNWKQYVDFNEADNKYYTNKAFDALGDSEKGRELQTEINNLINKYNELTGKVKDSEKAQRESAKAMRDLARTLKKSYSDLITRVAEDMAKLDQKEIDEVKKKYQMIQEEDDKYLEALQKSIDKQRKLRDQAKSYDDLEKSEKRLALLERDTSGANVAEIAALKDQIKQARQGLVDTEQDNIVNKISDENKDRKDKMDEETKFLQNVMDERTYDMQYYLEKARDIVDAAINGDAGAYQQMLQIMQEAEESFFRVTKEEQDQWMNDLKTNISQATDWVKIAAEGYGNLTDATLTKIEELSTKMSDSASGANVLSEKIEIVDEKIKAIDGAEPFKIVNEKLNDANRELDEFLNKLKDGKYDLEVEVVYRATGDVPGGSNSLTPSNNNEIQGYAAFRYNDDGTVQLLTYANDKNASTTADYTARAAGGFAVGVTDYEGLSKRFPNRGETGIVKADLARYLKTMPNKQVEQQVEPTEDIYSQNQYGAGSFITENNSDDKLTAQVEFAEGIQITKPGEYEMDLRGSTPKIISDENGRAESYTKGRKASTQYDKCLVNEEGLLFYHHADDAEKWYPFYEPGNSFRRYKAFANGGVVDYTGPAWVDGTPSKPEAFLSAEDTRNLDALLQALSIVSNGITNVNTKETSEKHGDTHIEIHVDVEEIATEQDVEEMLDVIQERITEASEGQVTIVRH